ncbi:hypothetical protein ACUODF_56560, partial [Escherichia coli]
YRKLFFGHQEIAPKRPVSAEMRYGLKYVEEQEILFGDGTGVHLHGIVPQASAFDPAFSVESQKIAGEDVRPGAIRSR